MVYIVLCKHIHLAEKRPMKRDGETCIFNSKEEAQAVADTHNKDKDYTVQYFAAAV